MTKRLTILSAGLLLAVLPGAAPASEPETSLCDPVPVKTHSGVRYEAFCRLAQVVRGTVPCAHVNTARVVKCTFTSRSGEWIESTNGALFAIAGQPISRDGRKGGMYVIASKRGKDGRPPCAAPRRSVARAADSAGTAQGVEIAGSCSVEVSLSATNRSGLKLRHFTTKKVCTSSYPHPDGAALVSRPSPGVYCYSGTGAGLNNVSGQEYDSSNRLITGNAACHIIWSGGYEIFAAKRPAFRNFPAPGAYDPTTPIVWRPYSPYSTAAI